MRKTALLAALAATAALTLGTAIADNHVNPAVKARTSIMQLYANNLGQLGAMAKGSVDYDAEAASKAANNLGLLVQLDQSTLWPEGTDNATIEGTRALPDLWSKFPDVLTKGQALTDAVGVMQTAAGTDLAALQGAMDGIGKACGACHKAYREPDK